ncbi:uncharacterized protein [Dysidea avara]|uniref:uncharacterized protein n=1 Tax=Dysidea avara TaxID=196820 RepID=UPI0033260A51
MNELVKATFAKAYGEIEQYSDCQWKIIFKKLVDHNLADDEHQQEIDGEQQQEVDEQQQQQVNDDDESQHGEQQQQEVDDGQKQHDKLKLRIIRLAEEICSFDQYRTLIEVLLFDCSFKELAKSMVDVFCILKYEVDIIEAVNYEEMLFALNSKKFFTKYDKQWLNISNNSNIFEVLYTKEIHDFPIFFKCLSSVKDSKTIVLKIKKEKENLLAPISSALGTYQQYLIQRYTSPSFMAIDNIFSTPHCHFIDPLLKEINKHEQHSSLEHCLLFKQTYSKSISLSNIFCDNEHRVILLQGSPGSGKTTLSKHLCSKWVIGELLQQYSHVIFVELRDTRIASNVTSVKEFIALHRGEHANSIATEIYTKNGKDTMFILEGWDELRVSDTELSYNFLTDLIRGMCLPDAHIIITSRPCGLKTLRLQFVSHMIEILGFSNEQVEQYVQCYFQEGCDSTAEARFWNLLQSHPHFKNMLIVPVTLCIFLYVFENTNNQIPQTLTRIYEHLIKFVLCRNQSRTQQVNSIVETLDDLPNDILSVFNKLGELAFYGLLIDKLTFSKKEISKYCWNSEEIPRNFDGMGILQEKTNVYCNFVSSIYQFLHRTVQEFLAARYLSQQTKSLQQDALKELFGNNDMEMVWIFYGGLTGFKSIVIKDFLPNSVSRKLGTAVHNVSVHAWEIIGHTLFKFSSLKSMIKAYFTKQGYSRYICSSILSREFLCTLLVAALEAQNPKFCAALCTSYLFNGNICWITVPESVVTPQILLGLSYFIAHSGK